jgi:hypothetical protein
MTQSWLRLREAKYSSYNSTQQPVNQCRHKWRRKMEQITREWALRTKISDSNRQRSRLMTSHGPRDKCKMVNGPDALNSVRQVRVPSISNSLLISPDKEVTSETRWFPQVESIGSSRNWCADFDAFEVFWMENRVSRNHCWRAVSVRPSEVRFIERWRSRDFVN